MISMESGDTIVYAAPGSTHYIARFDDMGWLTWPAKDDGWRERKSGKESDVDPLRELDAKHARLARKLSGVR